MNYMPRFAAPRRRPATRTLASPETVQAWREANAAEWDWINAGASRGNDFACSLNNYLSVKGRLTDGQLTAVQSAIVRDAARTVERAAKQEAAPIASCPEIETAFARAKAAGIKRPKMILADYRFSAAPATGANPGAIYLKRTEDNAYLGKVADGRFVRSRECSDQIANDVLRVMADPRAAAIAHGKQYGICSCCGRELTDATSVARGVGPVCYANYFGG